MEYIMNKDSQIEEKIKEFVTDVWNEGENGLDRRSERQEELSTLLNTEIDKERERIKALATKEVRKIERACHKNPPKWEDLFITMYGKFLGLVKSEKDSK